MATSEIDKVVGTADLKVAKLTTVIATVAAAADSHWEIRIIS
jgi:hypothetical protein